MTYFNSKFKLFLFPIIWIIFTAALQWLGKPILRYEHDVLSSLELWRLLTGHWVHLNWTHWLLNNLALILLVAITKVHWRLSFWIKVVLIHSLLISIAFLLLNSELNWYVGFSGVLYGLFMLAALLSFKNDKFMSALLMLIVFFKVAAEQFIGSEISTEMLLGAPVIVDAHAYGLLVGIVLGVLLMTKQIKIT